MIWLEHFVSAPGWKKPSGNPSAFNGTCTLATGPMSVRVDEALLCAFEQPARRSHPITIGSDKTNFKTNEEPIKLIFLGAKVRDQCTFCPPVGRL
jgi:hypothetical protein